MRCFNGWKILYYIYSKYFRNNILMWKGRLVENIDCFQVNCLNVFDLKTCTTNSVFETRAVGQLYSCYIHFTEDGQASTRGMTLGSTQWGAANKRQNTHTFTPPTISTWKYQELIALFAASQPCI